MFPVLEFKFGKYDLMLGQNSGLFHYFDDGGIKNPIKRGTRYLQMRLEKTGITFLDVLNYMPPGTNLDKYIRGFGIKHGKFVFPYEWFDAYDKLELTEFPPKDAFYSSLRGETISDSLYREAHTFFDAECETMLDFLKHYNNRDVGPFLQAITEHFQFFKDQGLDMFQDGMTVSSLAEKLMFIFAHRHNVSRDELLALAPGEPLEVDRETLQQRIDSYREQDVKRKERKAKRDALYQRSCQVSVDVETKHDSKDGSVSCDMMEDTVSSQNPGADTIDKRHTDDMSSTSNGSVLCEQASFKDSNEPLWDEEAHFPRDNVPLFGALGDMRDVPTSSEASDADGSGETSPDRFAGASVEVYITANDIAKTLR